ncbi:MAG TPA: ATP-binding cassette domain-containing protein [Streptosporangiaceae bacterium]
MLSAGLSGSLRLPPDAAAALIPILVAVAALDVYCLIDLVRAPAVRLMPKIVWAIVILLVSAPVGALVYLFLGRDRNHRPAARPPGAPGPGQAAPAQPAQGQPAPGQPPLGHPDETGQPAPGQPAEAGWVAAGQAPGQRPAADTAIAIVTTNSLTRDYGGTGLFEVDLTVPHGSIYGLVGPNGAGKTTLLSIICGTRRADKGTVSLGVARNRIAVCPDVPEFDGWLTASEVVDLARSLVAPGTGSEAVSSALAVAGLADSADRRVGGFSRGMMQRLGLACALVGDPELLILDEPTAALDPAGRAEILSLVAAMRGSRTVIFSSHILADVQRIADQVGILRDGRLLYQGAARDLIETYLRPRWLLRIAGDRAQVAAAIAGQPWSSRVEDDGTGALRIDATSIEEGERGIPAVVASCAARMVSCEPVAADLESAFLALTGATAMQAAK